MSRTRRRRARIMRQTGDDRLLKRVAKATRKFGWSGGWARAFAGSSWEIAEVNTERPRPTDVQ